MRRFLRDNALSVTMFGCFLVLWAAQSVTGFHAANADNRQHHQPLETYPNYLTTGHFVEATAENWESEFLQMSGYIFLTAFLRQRGSPESKPFQGDETDEDPRDARDRPDVPWPVRRGGLVLTLYEHSFALVLFVIFLALLHRPRHGWDGGVQQRAARPRRPGGVGPQVHDHLAVLVPVVPELAERIPGRRRRRVARHPPARAGLTRVQTRRRPPFADRQLMTAPHRA
jgi:hypothetical protein